MLNWKNIWEKKSVDKSLPTLEALMKADGFDSGFGSITLDAWLKFVKDVSKYLKVQESESVYEVGCGSGAFLYPFYENGHKVGGLDYAKTLVESAKNVMQGMEFVCMEADKLDTTNRYDVVLSNGVFLYFPDYVYTENVVQKMIKKANRAVAILDVNDKAKKELAKSLRRGTMSSEEYEKKYAGLDQLYYDKSLFEEIAMKNGLEIKIIDQDIEGYTNSQYRYNVYLFKS